MMKKKKDQRNVIMFCHWSDRMVRIKVKSVSARDYENTNYDRGQVVMSE